MYLLPSDEFRDVPDLLDHLDWPWHVNMPLDHLHLGNFYDPFDVLNLWHTNLDYLLLRDWPMRVPDYFARLDWPGFGFRLRASARPDRGVGFHKKWVCEGRPSLYMLDRRHVDLYRSLLDWRVENLPDLFDGLCWPWHVAHDVLELRHVDLCNLCLDLWHLIGGDVLDLRHVELYQLLIDDGLE